jgi:hypothetical protein
MAKSSKGFKSVAHRKAVFATDPELGQAIADKHGAKVGGGFSKKQLADRAARAAHTPTPRRDRGA